MRRLRLVRETLRLLTDENLAAVRGGADTTTAVPTTSHATTTTKQPTTSRIVGCNRHA